MGETKSQLEKIFETLCQDRDLSVDQDCQIKTAQGPLYFLESDNQEKWTRLLYVDKVASADFYDFGHRIELAYTILSPYQQGQDSFLQTLDSDIARNLLEKLRSKNIQADRSVFRVDLDDLSEAEGFLINHMQHY